MFRQFSFVTCVFLLHQKNGDLLPEKLLLIFFWKETHAEKKKNMDIVEERFRIKKLQQQRHTLEIVEDFRVKTKNFEIFGDFNSFLIFLLFSSFFFIFTHFYIFLHFFQFFSFSFFSFFHFFIFFVLIHFSSFLHFLHFLQFPSF